MNSNRNLQSTLDEYRVICMDVTLEIFTLSKYLSHFELLGHSTMYFFFTYLKPIVNDQDGYSLSFQVNSIQQLWVLENGMILPLILICFAATAFE